MKYCLNANINYYDCFNVQIMIRTIGLGRALGRVRGRVLGREVNRDVDEALNGEGPQHSHVGNEKLHLLSRMFTIWIMQMTRSMNSLKK